MFALSLYTKHWTCSRHVQGECKKYPLWFLVIGYPSNFCVKLYTTVKQESIHFSAKFFRTVTSLASCWQSSLPYTSQSLRRLESRLADHLGRAVARTSQPDSAAYMVVAANVGHFEHPSPSLHPHLMTNKLTLVTATNRLLVKTTHGMLRNGRLVVVKR